MMTNLMLHQIKHLRRLLKKYNSEISQEKINTENDYEHLLILLIKEFDDSLLEGIETIGGVLQNDRELYKIISMILANCAGQMIARYANIVSDKDQVDLLKTLFLKKLNSTIDQETNSNDTGKATKVDS